MGTSDIVEMAAEASTALTAVKPTGVPHHLKTAEVMNDTQWRTLLAIMDTLIPSIQRASQAPRKKSLSVAYVSDQRYSAAMENFRKNTVLFETSSEADIERVLAEQPSDDVAFRQQLQGMLLTIPQQTRKQLLLVLSILRYVHLPEMLHQTCFM